MKDGGDLCGDSITNMVHSDWMKALFIFANRVTGLHMLAHAQTNESPSEDSLFCFSNTVLFSLLKWVNKELWWDPRIALLGSCIKVYQVCQAYIISSH